MTVLPERLIFLGNAGSGKRTATERWSNITRLPTESWDITGLTGPDYPPYKIGPVCSVPGCTRLADHAHHITRRSAIGGAFDWVRMPDTVEIGNKVGLCVPHHDVVTANNKNITYNSGVFYWDDGEPLTYQPPRKAIRETGMELMVEHTHDSEEEREKCPTCGRKMPKPKIDTPSEEKKTRQTFGIAIPVKEREGGEDGYEVLSELIDAARDTLDGVGISYGDGSKVNYYVVSTALALFVQHGKQILSNA